MRKILSASLFLFTFAMLSFDAEGPRVEMSTASAQTAPEPGLADIISHFGTNGQACDPASGACMTLNPRTRVPITATTQIPSGSQLWVCNPGVASCTQSTVEYLCGPTICYCDGVLDCLDLWLACPSNYTFDCGWDIGQCICVDPESK